MSTHKLCRHLFLFVTEGSSVLSISCCALSRSSESFVTGVYLHHSPLRSCHLTSWSWHSSGSVSGTAPLSSDCWSSTVLRRCQSIPQWNILRFRLHIATDSWRKNNRILTFASIDGWIDYCGRVDNDATDTDDVSYIGRFSLDWDVILNTIIIDSIYLMVKCWVPLQYCCYMYTARGLFTSTWPFILCQSSEMHGWCKRERNEEEIRSNCFMIHVGLCRYSTI